MKSIKDIILRLHDVYSVKNNKQLALKMNVNYNTINTWIKRDAIPYDKLHEVVQKEQISFDWLLDGIGEMCKNENIAPTESTNDKEFMLYYDILKNTRIVNQAKKVYKDNPLLNILLDDSDLISFPNNLFIVNDRDNLFLIFKIVDSQSAIKYFLDFSKYRSRVFPIIFKNDISKNDYPLLEDDYLGEIHQLNIRDGRFLFKDGIELTPDEFSKLTIVAIED